MASYIKTLKDERENIIYPQTLASAVVTTGGSDAQAVLDSCVKAVDLTSMPALTPAVTTALIADNAVTNSKVDWSTLPQSSSTNSSYVKIGNILIQYGQIQGLVGTSDFTISFPQSFANTNYTVTVTAQYQETGQSFWWGFICSKAALSCKVRGGYKAINSSGGGGNTNSYCNWIAIGEAA